MTDPPSRQTGRYMTTHTVTVNLKPEWVPEGGRHQDRVADGPSVAECLGLKTLLQRVPCSLLCLAIRKEHFVELGNSHL